MKKYPLLIFLIIVKCFNSLIAQNQSILIPYQDKTTQKWGYVDENKNIKIPFQYTSAEKFSDGLAKIYFENDSTLRFGGSYFAFIDTAGKIAFKFDKSKYHAANNFSHGFSIVEGKYPNLGGINKKGELILEINYCFIGLFDSNGLAKIKQNCIGKVSNFGLIDTTGKIILPPKYDEIGEFKDGIAYCVETKEVYSEAKGGFESQTKYGLIDNAGKEIAPAKYDEIRIGNEGMWPIRINNKYGFINKKGIEIVPPKYDRVEYYKINKGVLSALVERNDKELYLNLSGTEDVLSSADWIGEYVEGLARFIWDDKKESRIDGGINEVDNKGNVLDGFNNSNIDERYSDGDDDKKLKIVFGFIDKSGNEIITRQYEKAENFHNGIAKVCKNKKYGFIDKEGKEVIPLIYDNIGDFVEGLAWVKNNGQYGYIDLQGKLVIPFKNYIAVGNFSEGMAWVAISKTETFNQDKCYGCLYDKSGKLIKGEKTTEQKTETKKLYGFINKQGVEVIPPKYIKVNDFNNGTAKVKLSDGSDIIINK